MQGTLLLQEADLLLGAEDAMANVTWDMQRVQSKPMLKAVLKQQVAIIEGN